MSESKFTGDNPFLLWVLKLNGVGAVEIKASGQGGATKDVILGPEGGRRFGLGFHGKIPCLGYVDTDRSAIEHIRWTSAAMLLDKGGKDFIALSCIDARPDQNAPTDPVPLRLFVPVSRDRMAEWRNASPKELSIAPITRNKKREAVFPASPFRTLPLKIF